MKKHLLLILFTLGALSCWADPVDLAKARQLASDFMKGNQEPTLVNSGKSMRARRAQSTTNQTSNPPYYIFSRGEGQGFVVVGGDDIMPEIIGYTETGDFDEDSIPESFRDFLYGYEVALEKYNAFVEANGEEAAAEVKAQALARRKVRRKAVATTDLGPLMSSTWEQGWPYYDFCPWDTNNNARCLTGCVATSTSSVIHYWRNDNPRYLMTGTHAYTTYTSGFTVDPGYDAGHPMKWELMQDSYSGTNYGSNNDHYTSVSELLAIVGDLVDMDYTSNSSGAQSSKQHTALEAFNLTGTNTWYSGVNDMDTWEDMMQNDLVEGRPILYSGYSVDSNNNWAGHAFVVDGYKLSDGKYHIDFGWGSSWKGYWEISDCNGYNTDQSMTYLIYPKKLNLSAQISAPSFSANANNAVTVTVQNNGTLDYTGGVYLFCSTSSNQPTSLDSGQADDTAIPAGGGDVTLSFTVNPGDGDSWYLIVVDKNLHVLARVKVPTTETLEEVTSTYITNPSFESYNSSSKPTGWTLGTSGQYSRDAENWVYYAVGHDGDRVLDSWVSGDTGYGISQTLSGLPEGYYLLTAKVATSPGNTVTVYAGDSTVTTEAHECGKYYLQDVAVDRIYVSSAGTLTIGINPGSWYKADDFRLYRYLTTPEPEVAVDQRPHEGQTCFDITDAMAPWLSTASLGAYTNNGFAVGTWGSYSGTDGASLTAPFIEKWTPSGNYLDDASFQQTIQELPNGTYYLGGSFIATSQGVDNDNVEGITFWAGDQSISLATVNKAPEIFALKVTVTDGTLTFGMKTECTNANWVAVDNLFLYWAGSESNYIAQATETVPVRLPLTNPRMEESLDGWTQSGSWQSHTTTFNNIDPPFMECWTNYGSSLSDRSVLQLMNLYPGTYQLAASVNATQQGDASVTVSGVSLTLGSTSVACHTANKAPEVFTTEKFTTEGGNTVVGLYISNTNANWVAWDNVVLYCYEAEVDSSEVDEYWRVLKACQQARTTYESQFDGAASAALEQYTWTESEYASKTDAEIEAAISVLTNGILIAAASQTATGLVQNADFKGGTSSGSVQGSGGRVNYPAEWQFNYTYSGWNDTYVDTSSGLFNAWAGTITLAQLSQSLSSLPNGTYRLSADIRVDQTADVSQTTLFGTSGSVTTNSEAAGSDIAGSTTDFATYTFTFSVTDNVATIGIISQSSFYQLKNIVFEFVPYVEIGDVTRDGAINISDAVAVSRILLGEDTDKQLYNHTAADLNGTGGVTLSDLTLLIKQLMGE